MHHCPSLHPRSPEAVLNSTETIFDDVFKTICERMPDLLVPVINEAFGTDYVLRNKPQMQERAGEIMGGKVLQLESERLREEGESNGERRFSKLIVRLTQDGRSSEILEAAQDSKKREELMKEYNLV